MKRLGRVSALILFFLVGCQRTFLVEDVHRNAVSMSEEEAREVLGKWSRVFKKWGEIEACWYTSYDLYYRGRYTVFGRILVNVITFPIYFVRAPVFGLREVAEARFSSGRVWQREYRRRWLWFFPLQPSPAWRYCQALVRLHGENPDELPPSPFPRSQVDSAAPYYASPSPASPSQASPASRSPVSRSQVDSRR